MAVASYVQNLTGFAFGLLLLGLVGLLDLTSLADVTNVASVLTLVNALALFRSAKPQFDREVMTPTLVASLPGVLLGVVLLNWLNDNVIVALRLLLGVTIIFIQTYHSQRAVERLRTSVAPMATVLRDGAWSQR